jgi:hypothetical protein
MAALRIPLGVRARLARLSGGAARLFISATKASLTWLVPMLLTASVTAYISYFYNQKANTSLVIQQQKIADLQQFRSSGAQLDQALGRMSDALVDQTGLEAARREMRSAIGRNITDADASRTLIGQGIDAYITGLAELRETVDGIQTPESGADLWQRSLNMMEMRRRLLKAAEQRALIA